ncbi:MAG: NlpC/P60 family protein [Desulfobacterales bacterium]
MLRSSISPGRQRSFPDTQIEKRLREESRRWQGTRHRMGGNNDSGIDCSGFVKAVYKDVFDLDLPRTTRAQARLGRPIAFKEIRAGDLVFFKPPTYPRHVGIFLGESEFVHASKARGVTVSRIDEYYWSKCYWTARRILPAAE